MSKDRPPEVSKRRYASFLDAHNVDGSLVQGKASAVLEAVLTDEDNQPLHGQTIYFTVSGSGKDLGNAPTNHDGIAKLESGQKILDLQTTVFGAASGYEAEFKGSANFTASKAHGRINATF
ncbi:Ig-like domain-containing protein [Kitasatospora sp. NPDC058162]|uniref:Ig-like domain-containing protein n=1 Tax=Kitasatospora sp. NPDC058162 TaxID=3346362 RepID=UPI0036DB56B9